MSNELFTAEFIEFNDMMKERFYKAYKTQLSTDQAIKLYEIKYLRTQAEAAQKYIDLNG